MATNGEIAAFENFKFNIGDTVYHKAGALLVTSDAKLNAMINTRHVNAAMVLARCLWQSPLGIEHCYRIRGEAWECLIATEEELELVRVDP